MKICNHPECNKQTIARGYCMGHYRRLLRHGDVDLVLKVRSSGSVETIPEKHCSVDGCTDRHYGNGFCQSHMLRLKKVLTLKSSYEFTKGSECLHDNCTEKSVSKGYCRTHYTRVRKYGDSTIINKKGKKSRIRSKCIHPGCGGIEKTSGYCSACYQMVRKYGTPDVPRGRGIKNKLKSLNLG